MHYMLGRFRTDIEAWKAARERYREHNEQQGQHFQWVAVNVDDPGEIFFLFKLDDLASVKAMYAQQGGGQGPEYFFLEER